MKGLIPVEASAKSLNFSIVILFAGFLIFIIVLKIINFGFLEINSIIFKFRKIKIRKLKILEIKYFSRILKNFVNLQIISYLVLCALIYK